MNNITVELTSGPQVTVEITGKGPPGMSAYQAAVIGGYTGTEQDFYQTLGTVGATGIAPYPSVENFPATGNAYMLYIDTGTNKLYRWDVETGAYVEVGGGAPYEGDYTVTPSTYNETTLPTEGKLLAQNVSVEKIPQFEVSNTSGGTTLIIGEEYYTHGN